MVIDNLNVTKQMKHQMDTWGFYSEEIQDYTRRGLQQRLQTPEGKRLALIVDPFSYRANITMPTLIVKGANDPYWTVDALSQYWDDLKQPKWAVTVPNAGHGLGTKVEAVESIGAFARSISGDFPMPKQTWSITESTGPERTFTVFLKSDKIAPERLDAWVAESGTLDFRKSEYKRFPGGVHENPLAPDEHSTSTWSYTIMVPPDKNIAIFAEARYRVGKREFSLCCPTQVFKKK